MSSAAWSAETVARLRSDLFATTDRVRDRSRPDQCRAAESPEDARALTTAAAGSLRMHQRALEHRLDLREVAALPLDLGEARPRVGQAGVILPLLVHVDCALDERGRLVERDGAERLTETDALDGPARREPLARGRACGLDGVQHHAYRREVARLTAGVDELEAHLEAGVFVPGQRQRALEQRAGRREVVARERPASCRREQRRRALAELRVSSSAGASSQRARYACSRWCPRNSSCARPCSSSHAAKRSCSAARVALGMRCVGRVADEDVAEAEGVLADEARRLCREDEALADERVQVRPDARRELRRGELDDRAPPELLADHRGALDDVLFLGIEPVEACGEQRVRSTAGSAAPRPRARPSGRPRARACRRRRACGRAPRRTAGCRRRHARCSPRRRGRAPPSRANSRAAPGPASPPSGSSSEAVAAARQDGARAAPAARARARASARRGSSRRGTRSGRAASARPSASPRAGGRAAATARPPRGACARAQNTSSARAVPSSAQQADERAR